MQTQRTGTRMSWGLAGWRWSGGLGEGLQPYTVGLPPVARCGLEGRQHRCLWKAPTKRTWTRRTKAVCPCLPGHVRGRRRRHRRGRWCPCRCVFVQHCRRLRPSPGSAGPWLLVSHVARTETTVYPSWIDVPRVVCPWQGSVCDSRVVVLFWGSTQEVLDVHCPHTKCPKKRLSLPYGLLSSMHETITSTVSPEANAESFRFQKLFHHFCRSKRGTGSDVPTNDSAMEVERTFSISLLSMKVFPTGCTGMYTQTLRPHV